jgi:hypothetical protein
VQKWWRLLKPADQEKLEKTVEARRTGWISTLQTTWCSRTLWRSRIDLSLVFWVVFL